MNLYQKIARVIGITAITAAISCTGAFGLYAAEVKGDGVNLRQTAGGTVMTSLPANTKIAVIENSTEWYKVATNGMTGYISGKYVQGTPDCDFGVGTATVVCDTTVNVRASASTDAEVLTAVSNGGLIWVAGVKNDWYKVTVGNITGYMAPQYVNVNSRMASTTSRGSSTDAEALRNKVLNFATQFLGTRYVYGGSTPSGFDCSGFTSYVYANTVRSIPRTATQQRNALTNVSMSELKPADLVFFGSGGSISHVGIYVGGGKFIHSPNTGSSVKYDTLWSGNYSRRFVSGGRVIFD